MPSILLPAADLLAAPTLATAPFAVLAQDGGTPAAPVQEPSGDGEGASGGGFGSMWVPMLLIFAVFYFVLIAPEKKNRKKREEMLGALKKGDKVMTTGGLIGSVAAVAEDVVTLQVADGVRLRYSRNAVQTVLEADETTKS